MASAASSTVDLVPALSTANAWYEPVAPPVALDRLIACSWTARPTGRHLLTPDACVDLVLTSDGAFVLCGPERRSWEFELPQHTTAVGVRLRPGAAHAVFGLDVSTIADRRTTVAKVIGPQRANALQSCVKHISGLDGQRTALVEGFSRLAADRAVSAVDAVTEEILHAVVSGPRVSQRVIAHALGVTTRQLHRLSYARFGFGTATLARIVRFQRVLSIASTRSMRYETLTRLAADAGYADQAHLSRDCRAITGQTPSAFLAGYFATFPDMSDPFKLGRRFDVTIAG